MKKTHIQPLVSANTVCNNIPRWFIKYIQIASKTWHQSSCLVNNKSYQQLNHEFYLDRKRKTLFPVILVATTSYCTFFFVIFGLRYRFFTLPSSNTNQFFFYFYIFFVHWICFLMTRWKQKNKTKNNGPSCTQPKYLSGSWQNQVSDSIAGVIFFHKKILPLCFDIILRNMITTIL